MQVVVEIVTDFSTNGEGFAERVVAEVVADLTTPLNKRATGQTVRLFNFHPFVGLGSDLPCASTYRPKLESWHAGSILVWNSCLYYSFRSVWARLAVRISGIF